MRKVFIIGIILILISCKEEDVIITRDYIKTGWLLNDTFIGRVRIEKIEIRPSNYDYIKTEDSWSIVYDSLRNNTIHLEDSCYTVFSKAKQKRVYFEKSYKDWSWEEICRDSENTINSYGRLDLNQWYRFSEDIPYVNKNYIYIYIDSLGEVHQFERKRNYGPW